MNEKDKTAIFKYGIISHLIHDRSVNQTKYLKKIAERDFDVPWSNEKVRFKWRTFKKWLYLYRHYGYDGLKPNYRVDKGKSRKIVPEIQEVIKNLYIENDFKTVSNFYRYLLKEKIISPDTFTEVTLRNYLKSNDIKLKSPGKKARKSFEARHINILWTADFMHGPYVRNGKKKVKSYLCAIIDDHSRLLVGALFFLAENCLCLQKILKQAVLTYGIPLKLYCDNGKVFLSGYLHMVCARLGIALIHSKPYDSPSRGKIERMFLTIQNMFLPNIKYDDSLTLEVLNESFRNWVCNEYNLRVHKGIGEKPMDRYLNDVKNVKIREISVNEADKYFYHAVYRSVRNDSTIAFKNILYEVPAKYIGQKIEIRYPLDNQEDLRLFENEKQVYSLKKLDKHFNSENSIKYHIKGENNV